MDAATVTRESKSNLALAFFALGRERRADMTVFYAFCRVIDDLADESHRSPEEKARTLEQWHGWVEASEKDEPKLAAELRSIVVKYGIDRALLHEILRGVEMDLVSRRYDTYADLRHYCYHVASAVGLVSIEIFGYRNPACKEYAVELGLALQMTNILRDVACDLENGGRIYLPMEDLSRFHYSSDDLQARRYNRSFLALMEFEAARARGLFARAHALLPREDRRSMVAAQIMSRVYEALLARMEQDQFRVFEKSYRLSKVAKLPAIIAGLLHAW